MRKKIVLSFLAFQLLTVIIELLFNSCVDRCNDLPPAHFNINGFFEAKNIRYNSSGTKYVELTSNSSVKYDEYGIDCQASVSYYGLNSFKNISLIGSAQAICPEDSGYAGSEEIIASVVIFSDSIFDSAHLANDTLNEYFNISINGNYNKDLEQFISTKPLAGKTFALRLKQKPTASSNHKFRIEYYQTNGEHYTFSTGTINIQ
jgi:hypothetical protein